MANGNSIPTQVRAVDPFASYNSETVNKLTRMLTYGDGLDGLSRRGACDVYLDTTSTNRVVVTPGDVYKDDVWISITENHIVDFTEANEYYNFDTGFDEVGWYYVVLSYRYTKQRPAPQARILIIKPSQRSAYTVSGDWLFLKAVYVSSVGPGVISEVSSYDPENVEHKRRYVAKFAGTDVFLPTFNSETDQARILYVESEDEFYFGYSDRWGGAGGGGGSTLDNVNTTGFQLGNLVYINSAGDVALANSSLGVTTADGVVVRVGASTGRIQMSGRVENIVSETGQTVSVGNLLYLSKTESGRVTTQKTTPFHQFVGRCIEIQDSTTITALFVRGEPGGGAGIADLSTYVYKFIDSTSWISSGVSYYVDVDTSDIAEGHSVIEIWNDSNNLKIVPERIDCLTGITRVFMPINTENLHFLALGPSASTRLSSNVTMVTSILSTGSWQGAGPFYQDINVSSIENRGAVVMVKDANTNEVIEPENVDFNSTSVLRIWMPTNTEDLEVVAMGPTSSPGGTNLIGLNLTLASGVSWIPSGSLYYQELSLVTFEDNDVTMSFVDADTKQLIYPTLVDFIDGGTTARIWMPDDTHNVNVTIIG